MSKAGAPRVSRSLLTFLCLLAAPFLLANLIFQHGFETPGPDLPQDPQDVAPPNPESGATDLLTSTEFLYTGDDPIQTGVEPGTIESRRVAIIRGLITDRSGTPLPGVAVSILGHPELGQTLSREDGRYDMAVNGGGLMTLNFAKADFLTAQRRLEVPWRDWMTAPDVALVGLDPIVTPIDLTSGDAFQVAQGSMQTDADGSRQGTVLFPQGTTAELVFPNGDTQPISQLNVRATEYTVGPNGPQAMPAELPQTSGYTYALELSADEAFDAGATDVQFSQPLWFYVENFLGFPAGGDVPTGYYDRQTGAWIPSPDGRVIDILSTAGGEASVDVDGDGVADSGTALSDLGITTAELQQLAQLYTGGTSLWRVPIEHFTPWDCNWPYGPPVGATGPPDRPPTVNDDEVPDRDDPCEGAGSIIECQSRTLRESIAIAGTPFSLNYRSDRVRPGEIVVQVVASEASVPASLKRIDVSLEIAGRDIETTLPPDPDQTATLSWDGTDAYGRDVQGSLPATVTVIYWYDHVYYPPGDFEASFGSLPSGTEAFRDRSVGEVGISRMYTYGELARRSPLGVLDARIQGLGGWTLSPHHAYDSDKKTLFMGDGTRRKDSAGRGIYVINFVEAVEEEVAFGETFLEYPFDDFSIDNMDIAGDGTFWVGGGHSFESKAAIVRVLPDGDAETMQLGSGDARHVTLHPDGAVYYWNRLHGDLDIPSIVRLFDPDPDVEGDEEITVLLEDIEQVRGMIADADGGLYVSSSAVDQVFYIPPNKVGPDPITFADLNVVAGTGVRGFSGDGGLATAAELSFPDALELGPDGSLYIADWGNNRVRRVDRDGIIQTIAGDGIHDNGGDGLPATDASIERPDELALDAEGGLFIRASFQLRYVRPDGIIVTVAGQVTEGQMDVTEVGDGFPLSRIEFGFRPIHIGPDGAPYLGIQGGFSSRQGRLVKLASSLPGFVAGGNLIASNDGTQLFLFDIFGRHLQTVDTFTGEVLYEFDYDASGWLTTITDANSDITTIQRDAEGVATGILSPEGLLTQLTVNEDLLLAGLTNPEGETFAVGYDPLQNKLTSIQAPTGATSSYDYNDAGRLIMSTDALGGSSTLTSSGTEDSTTITRETALGEISTYESTFGSDDTIVLHNTTPAGAVTEIELTPNASEVIRRPDGVEITNLRDPDPRFFAAAPLLTSTLQTPGGKSFTYSKDRMVTLVDGAPLDVESLVETTQYGSRTYTRTFDKAARTITTQTPSGLEQVHSYDAEWRLVELQRPGLAPRVFTYNAEGDVTRIEQDMQFLEFEYDSRDRINGIRDPANRMMNYSYDDADRLTQTVLPSGRTYVISYDNNGNRTTIQMPNMANHVMGYSQIDLLESYLNPTGDEYAWAYDLDRRRTQIELPSMRTVDFSYDVGGRIDEVTYAEATVDYGFADATPRLDNVVWTPTTGSPQTLAYGYDGHLVESADFLGVANGSFTYSYDGDLKLTGIQLDMEPEITSTFNNDGLLVAHGPFTITRDLVSSLPSTVTDGTMTITYTFDSLGRVLSRTHELNSTVMYHLTLSYDTSGRLEGRTESVMGVPEDFTYTYDADEQLTGVAIDTVPTEVYAYDDNGNRTTANGVSVTFDAADSITGVGATSYTIDDDGFLVARGTDTFVYSARGEMLSATVGATQVDYTYDGLGRLVARTEGGDTTEYLYGNPASPFLLTHSRAPDSTLTTYFYNEAGLLMALERDGTRYYVAVDQVGSPRVIYDDMGIVKEITYDSFGVMLTDSNPVFALAIGFGGGIADPVTGLVRFGLRDYHPTTGRWTSRDPILFQGGPNLYMYAGNNPVLNRDPSGLFCTGGEAYAGIGAGIELCYKDGEWSYCSEVGLGAGGGLKLNPFGGVAGPEDHLFAKGEVVAGLGPLEVGGELKANDCGISFNKKCGAFIVNCSGELNPDLSDLLSDEKPSDAFDNRGGDKTAKDGNWRAGLSAKATAGGCLGSKIL